MTTTTTTDPDPIAEITAAITLGKKLATQARADLEAATPTLVNALRNHSGQSRKIEAVLLSLWNDDHAVNLCSELAGLDARLAQAVVSMIAARAHMGGDADDLLRQVIDYDRAYKPTIPAP
jgi:hypothetical protein